MKDSHFQTQEELGVLSKLPVVKRIGLRVTLSGSNLTDEGLAFVVKCQEITELYLAKTSVTEPGLVLLNQTTRLRGIGLPPTITDAGMKHIASLRSLEEIDARNTHVTDAGLLELRGLAKLSRFGAGLTTITLPGIAAAFADHDLKHIHVNIRDDVELEFLKHWPGIQLFYSEECHIGDSGLVYLSTLQQLNSLQIFKLKVSDTGLAPLANLTNLHQLHLSGATISDTGMITLGKMPQLRDLGINDTRIGDMGLAELAELTKLQRLSVLRTKVTESGIQKLTAALPQCRIEWDGGVIQPRAKDK